MTPCLDIEKQESIYNFTKEGLGSPNVGPVLAVTVVGGVREVGQFLESCGAQGKGACNNLELNFIRLRSRN